MIWFTLALFVVSFIITALLAPKPDFENARAGTLDDVQFPRATENAPIPLVLGRVRIKGPNTLWYGDYDTVAITEKVKTGLFNSKRVTVGYRYFLGLHLGLAIGPDVNLVEIYLDEELVWSGNTNGATTAGISINKPSLFGGFKSGGGWVSSGTYYNGDFTLPVDSYLEGQIGVGDVPAYNGMAHIVFNKAEIGEQNSLRPFAFVVESYTNALNLPDNGTVNGVDMNPMEAMYQILTDDWRGLGVDPANLDLVSMQAAGVTLHSEGNGCSIAVSNESDGKRVIQEILRQIDGIMYQDPETGQITIRLIREDYVVEDLPIFDENDIVEVKSFTRTTWEEVRAQVKVMYPQRDRDSERVAIAQDMAVIQTIGKQLTNTISFPFVFDDQLATDLAARNLAQASVPLFRVTLELNRNANQLRPGQPFVFSWDKYGIDQLVMRVQRFDLGSLLDGKIVVEAIQDSFAVSDTLFASSPTSGWVEVVTDPVDIVLARIVQMPAFFLNKLENPTSFGQPAFVPVAARPGGGSIFYQAAAWNPSAGETIDDATFDPNEVPYEGSGVLTVDYDRYAGFQAGVDDTVGIQLNSVVGAFTNRTENQIRTEFSGLIIINDEWLAYESAVDNGSGNWTLLGIHRGVLGTTPSDHASGSRLYSVPIEAFGEGLFDTSAQSQSSTFRLMDSASGIVQDITEGTELNSPLVFPALGRLGVRVGNVQLEGSRNPNQEFLDQVDRTLTWARRDQAPDEIALELDADQDPSVTGPFTETYRVEVFVDGVQNLTLTSATLPTGTTSYDIPLSLVEIDSEDVRAEIVSIQNSNSSPGRAIFPFQLLQGPGIITFTEQQVLAYTGADEDIVVPANVAQIQFALGGASGGGGTFSSGPLSGAGGYVEGELAVSEGDILKFQIGQGGRGGDATSTPVPTGGGGGWPDGGGGANGDTRTGGGGGSSRLWRSVNSGVDWELIAVAGGGGGSGGFIGDAGAGGINGQDASVAGGGTGGLASGAVGVDGDDVSNLTKQGDAISLTDPTPAQTGGWGSSVGDLVTASADDGGGGGGGFRGGGGGGGDGRPGGGGANYLNPALSGETNLSGNVDQVSGKMGVNPSYPGSNASVGIASNGNNVHGNNGWGALYYDDPLGFGAHRYWRILQEDADNASFYGIAEIEMRETVGGSDETTTGFAIFGDERAGFEATNAFDNTVSGNNSWSVDLGVTTDPADRWVGQDFGAGNEKAIREVQITARADGFPNQAPNDFRLQYSDDGVAWTDAIVITGEPNWSAAEARQYNGLNNVAQFWRVLTVTDGGNGFTGLGEIEMRQATTGTDLAQTGTVSASTEFSAAFDAEDARDQNGGTYWSTTGADAGPGSWWQLDLGVGNEALIDEVAITATTNQIYTMLDFDLQKSVDGTNWTTVLEVRGQGAYSATEQRVFN